MVHLHNLRWSPSRGTRFLLAETDLYVSSVSKLYTRQLQAVASSMPFKQSHLIHPDTVSQRCSLPSLQGEFKSIERTRCCFCRIEIACASRTMRCNTAFLNTAFLVQLSVLFSDSKSDRKHVQKHGKRETLEFGSLSKPSGEQINRPSLTCGHIPSAVGKNPLRPTSDTTRAEPSSRSGRDALLNVSSESRNNIVVSSDG